MASSAATTMRHSFERRAEDVKPLKSDINDLILDYLTTEGYPSAAAKFSKEAKLRPRQEEESIRARRQIQHFIHCGSIHEALDALNELEPEVLDMDPSLHFSLLRLQLIELIRTCNATPGGDITPALTFATSQLAPRAPTHKQFMEDLEKTMALLVFPSDNLEPSLAALLEPGLRRSVAESVNKAVLARQKTRREARIRKLARLRAWAEDTVRSNNKDIPARLDLGLNGEKGLVNGSDAMII